MVYLGDLKNNAKRVFHAGSSDIAISPNLTIHKTPKLNRGLQNPAQYFQLKSLGHEMQSYE
jgi:hypothetical protein